MAHAGRPEGEPNGGGANPERPLGPPPKIRADSSPGTSGRTASSLSASGGDRGTGSTNHKGPAQHGDKNPGVREALEDLPEYQSSGTRKKTYGYLLDADGRKIPYPYQESGGLIISGKEGSWKKAVELIQNMPFWQRFGKTTPNFASDVEPKAAIAALESGHKFVTIVINNTNGPCRGCMETLPYLVDPKGTIDVVWPGGSISFRGSKLPPEN
ncbi:DddA-like double-stranded DNA deaminase toxin [Nocardia sp. NPDC059764]|uniref:DddA-like double-stranded DNA deaminase toxin n=1 Tax=Nocardia sp. NPDC059764 TaxID=3346939 RepID=UPI003654B308